MWANLWYILYTLIYEWMSVIEKPSITAKTWWNVVQMYTSLQRIRYQNSSFESCSSWSHQIATSEQLIRWTNVLFSDWLPVWFSLKSKNLLFGFLETRCLWSVEYRKSHQKASIWRKRNIRIRIRNCCLRSVCFRRIRRWLISFIRARADTRVLLIILFPSTNFAIRNWIFESEIANI